MMESVLPQFVCRLHHFHCFHRKHSSSFSTGNKIFCLKLERENLYFPIVLLNVVELIGNIFFILSGIPEIETRHGTFQYKS